MLLSLTLLSTLLLSPLSSVALPSSSDSLPRHFPRDAFSLDVGLEVSISTAAKNGSFEKHEITAPDGSLKAAFIPWGSTMVEFWAKDKDGKFRDLVLGFDNLTKYGTDRQFFGPIVGRYANRIQNATFSVPITANTTNSTKTSPSGDPVTVYNVPANENDGIDSLHGGTVGYDLRPWHLLKKTPHSLEFGLKDENGTMGFPGTVWVTSKFELLKGGKYHFELTGEVLKDSETGKRPETPILLSQHDFWNLDAYHSYSNKQDVNATGSVSGKNGNHNLKIVADKVVGSDGILIPTGKFVDVEGTAYDFRKAELIGARLDDTKDFCGTGCHGYDTCFVYEKEAIKSGKDVLSLWSTGSGIKFDVVTNQPALQVYTCSGVNNGPKNPGILRKVNQGGGKDHPDAFYGYQSCVVLEQEGVIDAINQPEWGINQIYGGKDNRKLFWESTYTFSNIYH